MKFKWLHTIGLTNLHDSDIELLDTRNAVCQAPQLLLVTIALVLFTGPLVARIELASLRDTTSTLATQVAKTDRTAQGEINSLSTQINTIYMKVQDLGTQIKQYTKEQTSHQGYPTFTPSPPLTDANNSDKNVLPANSQPDSLQSRDSKQHLRNTWTQDSVFEPPSNASQQTNSKQSDFFTPSNSNDVPEEQFEVTTSKPLVNQTYPNKTRSTGSTIRFANDNSDAHGRTTPSTSTNSSRNDTTSKHKYLPDEFVQTEITTFDKSEAAEPEFEYHEDSFPELSIENGTSSVRINESARPFWTKVEIHDPVILELMFATKQPVEDIKLVVCGPKVVAGGGFAVSSESHIRVAIIHPGTYFICLSGSSLDGVLSVIAHNVIQIESLPRTLSNKESKPVTWAYIELDHNAVIETSLKTFDEKATSLRHTQFKILDVDKGAPIESHALPWSPEKQIFYLSKGTYLIKIEAKRSLLKDVVLSIAELK